MRWNMRDSMRVDHDQDTFALQSAAHHAEQLREKLRDRITGKTLEDCRGYRILVQQAKGLDRPETSTYEDIRANGGLGLGMVYD